MFILLGFFLAPVLCTNINQSYVISYFERFGYINTSTTIPNSITDISKYLIDFQERYNLQVDGTLNEETIQLLERPRCSHNENSYKIHSKWNKTNLKWYFPQAQYYHLSAAKMAFDIWQNDSSLTFSMVSLSVPQPDITITVVGKDHNFRKNCGGTSKCMHNFDGPGKILAHGFFPVSDQRCVEIHMDSDENWDYGTDIHKIPEDHTSFVMVLTHEIGHTLGLEHSNIDTAIMYPWYQTSITHLSEDDKNALENIYGTKKKTKKDTKQQKQQQQQQQLKKQQRNNQ